MDMLNDVVIFIRENKPEDAGIALGQWLKAVISTENKNIDIDELMDAMDDEVA